MGKLMLLSVIIGTISVPILSAAETNPRGGLLRALSIVAVFNLVYLLGILFVYPYLN